MTYPTFTSGDVLLASDMNAVGLWLVKTQVIGSAVSSVAVTSCFSSTYDNYLVTLEGGTCSADCAVGLQLGSSTTGYYGFLVYGAPSSATVQGATVNNGASFQFVGGGSSGQNVHVVVDLFGPNKAAYTKCYRAGYQNGGNYGHFAGQHQVATAYTGFTLIPSAGTLTGGTIRVYGYRN
jgi:hypothetical protein